MMIPTATPPGSSDRPAAGTREPSPAAEAAPPLAPATPEQSPWWSAPSGRPVSIPDFAHELRAWFALLVSAPQPVPVRVTARRR